MNFTGLDPAKPWDTPSEAESTDARGDDPPASLDSHYSRFIATTRQSTPLH